MGHVPLHFEEDGPCAPTLSPVGVPPVGPSHVVVVPAEGQPGQEDPPPLPIQKDLPPPPPLMTEVMDHQMHLLETLAEGMLCCNGGPPNNF